MAGYVALPAYQYPRNAALDFSPIDDAITGYRKAGYDNALMGLKEKADTRETESHDWDRQKFQAGLEDRQTKHIGALAQGLLQMSPEQRPRALTALRSVDKTFDPELRKAGFDPDDIDSWAPIAVAKARGVVDPYEDQKTLSEINKTNAQADYYRGGGRTGASGVRSTAEERQIDKYMELYPDATYLDAMEAVRTRPADRTRRERLSIEGAKGGYTPEEIDPWRDRYGVGPNSPSPQRRQQAQGQLAPNAGGTSRFDFSGRMRAGGSPDNPIVPRTQADIDTAPSGSYLMIDGKLHRAR